MAAIELVSDRATKKSADKKVMAKVSEAAYAEGVMIRVSGSNIILSPPLIFTAEEVQQTVSALDAALAAA
jgi:adenosylmethionine-8-amino-7-oxononanoate aminotransferase